MLDDQVAFIFAFCGLLVVLSNLLCLFLPAWLSFVGAFIITFFILIVKPSDWFPLAKLFALRCFWRFKKIIRRNRSLPWRRLSYGERSGHYLDFTLLGKDEDS